MVIVIGWIWAAVGAAMVAWLMERQAAVDRAALDRGEILVVRGEDSSLAFAVCALFPIAAPFFLAKARGGKGFLEGVLILVGATFMNFVTLVGLLLLRGH